MISEFLCSSVYHTFPNVLERNGYFDLEKAVPPFLFERGDFSGLEVRDCFLFDMVQVIFPFYSSQQVCLSVSLSWGREEGIQQVATLSQARVPAPCIRVRGEMTKIWIPSSICRTSTRDARRGASEGVMSRESESSQSVVVEAGMRARRGMMRGERREESS